MDDDRQDPDLARPERPGLAVLWGLLSLVAVAAIVGGVLAAGALVATRATGLADEGQATASTAERETLYLPRPTDTGSEPGSFVTLTDVPEPPLPSSTFSEPPRRQITLVSPQTAVGVMESIQMSGSYAGGDGAVLQVQQFEDGSWEDFPVTASVYDGDFNTYIQTGDVGPNRFRVVDSETGDASNEIRVSVG